MTSSFFRVIVFSWGLAACVSASADNATLELARKTFQQADAMAEAGRFGEAKLRLESTLEIIERVRAKAPGNVDADELRAMTLLVKASICVDLRQKAQATQLFKEAIAQYDDLARRDPKNGKWKRGAKIARDTLRDIDKF
jgi:tetratricopeptide (TPR) repeat protein